MSNRINILFNAKVRNTVTGQTGYKNGEWCDGTMEVTDQPIGGRIIATVRPNKLGWWAVVPTHVLTTVETVSI